tara:strand:- start:1461 stop:1784 length:324 start_codon:yes stop_codon:yes gene_type:complete
MEEKIKEAKSKVSLIGLGCKTISILGFLITIIYSIVLFKEKDNKDIYFWAIVTTALCSSVSVGALGSIADNSKKTRALTALLVESTNSASQIPLTQEFEYSDLNEDN